MVEIIPSINVQTFQEVRERVKLIEALGFKWAQFDVFDGVFTNLTGFNEPKRIKELKSSLNFEAHLMTWEPEHTIQDWIDSGACPVRGQRLSNGVKRILFHYEATHARKELIKEIKWAGLEVGICVKPVTPWQFAERYFKDLDLIQILGVDPGPYGQEFWGEEIINKIRTLREAYPNAMIEVDGGVNDKNAPAIVKAGANILVVGAYIFDSPNPREAVERLKKATRT